MLEMVANLAWFSAGFLFCMLVIATVNQSNM